MHGSDAVERLAVPRNATHLARRRNVLLVVGLGERCHTSHEEVVRAPDEEKPGQVRVRVAEEILAGFTSAPVGVVGGNTGCAV